MFSKRINHTQKMKLIVKLLSLAFVFGTMLVLSTQYNATSRDFSEDDTLISKKYKDKSTVSSFRNYTLSLLFPAIIIPASLTLKGTKLSTVMQTLFAFAVAHTITSSLVENLKNVAGRHRPDFLDRCKPKNGICTGDVEIINEGKRSFPSGHAATASCSLGFTGLLLNDRSIIATEECVFIKLGRVLVLLIMILYTVIVCNSRIIDHKHFLTDVIFGGLIGLITSAAMYIVVRKKF